MDEVANTQKQRQALLLLHLSAVYLRAAVYGLSVVGVAAVPIYWVGFSCGEQVRHVLCDALFIFELTAAAAVGFTFLFLALACARLKLRKQSKDNGSNSCLAGPTPKR